jgi:RNA polymerase sigma factor (sigma-70 family)
VLDCTDRNLAARCARGEAPAWRELVARHDRRILFVLGRALGRGGEAELLDLRQEVYARLLARDGAALRGLRAERPGALATFLARVALRVALDHARARGARLDASAGEAEAESIWRELPAKDDSPEQKAQEKQERRSLRVAIERACAGPRAGRDRVVLRAHFDDGLTPAEIARLGCGLSVKGVETLLRRARARIGQQLEGEGAGAVGRLRRREAG